MKSIEKFLNIRNISILAVILVFFTMISPSYIAEKKSNYENDEEIADFTVYYVHINTEDFNISAGIDNLGNKNGTISVRFYDTFLLFGRIPLFEREISTVEDLFIEEYGAAEICVVWESILLKHPILSHRIRVVADPDDEIVESDETNNGRITDIRIPLFS